MASFSIGIVATGSNTAKISGYFISDQAAEDYDYQRFVRVIIDGYGTVDVFSKESSGSYNTFEQEITGLSGGRTYYWSATLYYKIQGGWAASNYTFNDYFITSGSSTPSTVGSYIDYYDGVSGTYYIYASEPTWGNPVNIDNFYYVPIQYLFPTKTGYTFKGWYLYNDPTYGLFDYYNNSSAAVKGYISPTTSNRHTFYAVWEKSATTYYAYLSYNANGGSGAPSRTEHTFASNPVEAIISSVEPTRDGYTFAGWWLYNIEGHGTYVAGSKIKVEGSTNKTTALNNYNHMLYAQWKKGDGAGVAWVYDGKWKEAIPYVYDGGWKEAGGNVYNSGWKETI